MTLRTKTFTAVRWTTAGTITKALLQIGQVAVLARVLAPEDYGLMGMVMAVLGLAAIFSDFGVNSAFVQRRDVSEEQRTSLFWFNVLVSAGLMLLVIILSPLLASFFRDDRLTLLIILSSSTFVISAPGVQVRMAAEKALLFRGVMVVEVSAALIGFGFAVWAALAGWGVYALVTAAVVSALLTTMFCWLFLSQGWRPALRFHFSEVRSFLGFGGSLVANNVVNQINLTIDLLLGGRMLAAAQLGLYSVPRDLVLRVQGVVNPIITRVTFPLIAQVQLDTDHVRRIYLRAVNMTASTSMPIYMGTAFFADEVVTILLGDGWAASASILQVLAIWGALRAIGNPVGSLLLGMGRADLSLKWNLCLLVITPPVVWLGSLSGPLGMAWALLGLSITLFVPGWLILVRPICNAGLVEYCIVALRPLLLASLATMPAYLVASFNDAALFRLGIGIVIATPLYLGLAYFLNREWWLSMRELLTPRA